MHYYVDGYNLIFRLLKSVGEEVKSDRDELIELLEQRVSFLNLDMTLVFDSQYFTTEGDRSNRGDLEVVYTNHQETADDYILQELKTEHDPRQHTVVTSDKRLAWRARRMSAKTESVEEFMNWLERRARNKRRHERENKKPLSEQIEERIESLKKGEKKRSYEEDSELERWERLFRNRE